jgi:excisionase family DNA binding protein
MAEKETERLLTPAEIVTRLNVSLVTVGRWLREGKLKGVKAGRQWRVLESELEAFLKGRPRASNPLPIEDEPITKVVFRKWHGEGGGILALFPEIPADIHGHHCQSYQHVGQHGGADYSLCIGKTAPAAPGEYADLKEELESIGYRLEVVNRITPAMVEARRRALEKETA